MWLQTWLQMWLQVWLQVWLQMWRTASVRLPRRVARFLRLDVPDEERGVDAAAGEALAVGCPSQTGDPRRVETLQRGEAGRSCGGWWVVVTRW